MIKKQKETCPTCTVCMDFIKGNQYLKCPICAYTIKVEKPINKVKRK